jgi:hypothetical protein
VWIRMGCLAAVFVLGVRVGIRLDVMSEWGIGESVYMRYMLRNIKKVHWFLLHLS